MNLGTSCRFASGIAAIAALAFSGCVAKHESFTPTEHVQGHTVEGYREAFYDLTAGPQRYGEVKVWSRGADRVSTAQGKRTIIRVGFTIENMGDEPISLDLDNVRLESIQARTSVHIDEAGTLVSGSLQVPPNASGSAEIEFALPPSMRPSDVKAFRVRWSTTTDGKEFSEYTPFAQQPEYAYVPVYGYYYPYYPWDYPYYGPLYFDYPHTHVVIVAPYPRRVIIHGHRHRR